MSEKYKLGLTRNRLFEFDNCVLFCGKIKDGFEETELLKAFKMLCLKEPLLTSKIELQDDGEAFVVTESVEQKIKKISKPYSEIMEEYENDGIDFWNKVFEFSLSSDGFLVIAAHTAVCDAKSLLRLAAELYAFYSKESVSVEPSAINLFSEFQSLPVEVASPITDKLSAELDSKWMEKPHTYSAEDYKKAKSMYLKNRSSRGKLCAVVNKELLSSLQEYCGENNLDVSSVVAFSFYENLVKLAGGKRKYNKMNVYADERFFFANFKDYGVGAFNGVITADLNKKEKGKTLGDRVKQFHLNCYKGVTSIFKVFYDESLLMKVSPSLCDSAYMYKAGLNKNKTSKKLAENYGCGCEKICDFFACNLEQEYWKVLEEFSFAEVFEPLKMRSATYVGFVRRKGEGYITFKYKKDRCFDSQAQIILENSLQLLKKIVKK